MKFKVYVDYTTEEIPRPFYVGKGSDRRLRILNRNKLHTAIKNKYGLDRRVVFETDDEQEAFKRECNLIIEFNTHVYCGGWGANFTLGGEGTSGCKRPDQHGENHPMFGKTHSEESKRKNSESNKRACSGEKNGMFGKHHSEETRKILSERSKLKRDSDETRKKKSEAQTQRKGYKCSEQTKINISQAAMGRIPWNKGKKLGPRSVPRVFSEQARKNIAAGCKGRIPWNKGLNTLKKNITSETETTVLSYGRID